ncbi:MAG: Mu transposase C-terminal domain-containing protein [Thermodesulfovibrio sp.]|nr:Mu transposase C-terminal domain-containing protein [Thermodesulfovibrio sp.]
MIQIKIGTIVKLNGKDYLIESFSNENQSVILRDILTKSIVIKRFEELVNELFSENSLHIQEKSKSSISYITENEELYNEVIKRKAIIDEVINNQSWGRADVEAVAKKYNINYTTIYRWIKKYKDHGIEGLIPSYHLRGCKRRLTPEVEQIIKEQIEVFYLNSQKPKIKHLYEKIKDICLNKNLEVPHYSTIVYKVKKLDTKTVFKKREGRIKALSVEPLKGEFEASKPFEVIQIDHTKLDIIVVDEFLRKPVGRPWITLAFDVFSRMVYGFYLSFDPPSFFTVGQTLLMGIQPKNKYLESLGIEDAEWPIFGLPKGIILHTDNAKEFKSKELENFLTLYGIHQEFRPKKTPHYGGHIERFFRTINEELHKLPGTTFSNVRERGEYKSEKKSAMTLSELEKYIAYWIVNVYHKKAHTKLGMSPLEKFKKAVFGEHGKSGIGFPPLPKSDELYRIKISLLYTEERTIQRYGVRINHITYWGDVFMPYMGSKEKFTFKIDPRDISHIYFYEPKVKDYYKIPCKNLAFPSMTIWELKEVIDYLKKNNATEINEYEIASAYNYLETIKRNSMEKSKKVRREIERKRKITNQLKDEEQKKKSSKNKKENESKKQSSFQIKVYDVEVF